MDLTVTPRRVEDVVVLSFGGEVDIVTAPILRDAMSQVLAAGHHRIICDLTNVSFLDSTGLGVLVGRLKAAKMVDGEMRVVVTSARVRRNFKITGLEKIFDIDESVDDALKALAVAA